MNCYFQGCDCPGTTKEHIPPRCFFPRGKRDQLWTVRSCDRHNSAKSKDDMYALAHVLLSVSSDDGEAREIFRGSVEPQLSFGGDALRKLLLSGAVRRDDGSVAYVVDSTRLDSFFTALSCGIVYKTFGTSLPRHYSAGHIYHNLQGEAHDVRSQLMSKIAEAYRGPKLESIRFGTPTLRNSSVYRCDVFGLDRFRSSLTICHLFYETFHVTSMLSRDGYPDPAHAA